MKKFLFTFTLIVFCFAGTSFAQEKLPKVIKYLAPQYPAAARATGTTGEVVVAVKIDKDGKVISSKSESGHPLLRAISEKIAKEWLFTKSELSERELKISFLYSIKVNDNRKNNYKESIQKIRFRKPYRLEIISTEYPRIDI